MKLKQTMLSAALATATMCAVGAAFASPPVTVTFKNLGTQPATYKIVTANEVSTNTNASPKHRFRHSHAFLAMLRAAHLHVMPIPVAMD